MNYRHIYHAGNFADVFKHLLLVIAIDYYKQKNKPICVLDTHGGIGLYDLTSEQAGKTNEYPEGIGRLWNDSDAPAFVEPYLSIVKGLNEHGELTAYPGSPWVVQQLLRAHDRHIVSELHTDDAVALKENLRGQRHSQLEVLAPFDGYEALKAKLPPAEKRGLVLIDPPFESVHEFDDIVTAIEHGIKRWAAGSFAVWFPLKDDEKVGDFYRQLSDIAGLPKTLAIELMVKEPNPTTGLYGCGYVWVNPPYGVQQQLPDVMNYLQRILAQDSSAHTRTFWLVEES